MIDLFDFIQKLQSRLDTGHAKEHAYRPALQELFDSLDSDVDAVNEPRREAVGAPDFIFLRGGQAWHSWD